MQRRHSRANRATEVWQHPEYLKIINTVYRRKNQSIPGSLETNYQELRQRFSIFQSVFPWVVTDTGTEPEATLPEDQLVAGRSASTSSKGWEKRRRRRAKTVSRRRSPGFRAVFSLLTRKRTVSQGSPSFFVGGVFGTAATPFPSRVPPSNRSIRQDYAFTTFPIDAIKKNARLLRSLFASLKTFQLADLCVAFNDIIPLPKLYSRLVEARNDNMNLHLIVEYSMWISYSGTILKRLHM